MSEKRSDKRLRASTACENCRARRTKCMVSDNEKVCAYCIVHNLPCIFSNDDERKRPTSKAYVSSLLDRIAFLEKTIQDLGHTVPPFVPVDPPKSFRSRGRNLSRSPDAKLIMDDPKLSRSLGSSLPFHINSAIKQSFDTYYNVMGDIDINEALEKVPETPDGSSKLLGLCVLAMGLQLTDSTQFPHQSELLQEKKVSLLDEAKESFELARESQKNFTLVRACFILGDLELALGNVDLSWRYVRIATNMLQDVLGESRSFDEQESCRYWELARDFFMSYRIREHFWEICYRKPQNFQTTEKLDSQLVEKSSLLHSSPKPLNDQEGAGNFRDRSQELCSLVNCVLRMLRPTATGLFSVHTLLDLDRKLHAWYTSLPNAFRISTTCTNMHSSKYFLLHQQYHSAIMLLHWPFARYDRTLPSSLDEHDEQAASLKEFSRAVCARNAIRISTILALQRKQSGMRLTHFTTLQCASIATTLLVAAIEVTLEDVERERLLEGLHSLLDSLVELSQSLQPAAPVATLLRTMMEEDDLSIKRLFGSNSVFHNHILASHSQGAARQENHHSNIEDQTQSDSTEIGCGFPNQSVMEREVDQLPATPDNDLFTDEFLHSIFHMETNIGAGPLTPYIDLSET